MASDADQRRLEARRILHVDMDAFYASVEQRDDPNLRGRPVAVGGTKRGVVAAASYEARRFGVKSAMPSVTALRRCPDLVFVKPRFEVYRAVSQEVRAIFARHAALIEPLSLDEAYLDVGEAAAANPGGATAIARSIKREIVEATGLTASAGVSYNKFLAKLASDEDKPDGLFVIRPEDARAYLRALPIGRFFGVGPVTARKLEAMGLRDGAALQDADPDELARRLGKFGRHLARIARAEDPRPVSPDRRRKSVGVERTYGDDRVGLDMMDAALDQLAASLWERLERSAFDGRALVLKFRLPDFTTRTRTQSEAVPIRLLAAEADAPAFLAARGKALLRRGDAPTRVRLLGLTVAGDDAPEDDERQYRLALEI